MKGIFVKDSNGDMVNVVNRDDNIDTLSTNQTRLDMNNDGKEDIIMWDQKQVRIKYNDPNKPQNRTAFTRLYKTSTFNSPNDISDAVSR